MKILHTADLHLKENEEIRLKTLIRLIRIAQKEDVNIFVISGDLFDKGVDAERLRPRIRQLFSDTNLKIIILPGNHDSDSYRKGMDFGEDVYILTDLYTPFHFEDVNIWGMPFESLEGWKILKRLHGLSELINKEEKNILLLHGELLDTFFLRGDFGEEGETRYMPVRLSYFNDLGLDYVLAGHFHTRFDVRSLSGGGYFVYPGSPVSITLKETGQRQVNIFKIGEAPRSYLIDSPYYEEVCIMLDPFVDENPMESIRKRLNGIPPYAMILMTVKGFINSKRLGLSEAEIIKLIKEAVTDRSVSAVYELMDIQEILEDDLFKGFLDRLMRQELSDDQKSFMMDMTIRAIMGSRT